jgi:hypothetical protein
MTNRAVSAVLPATLTEHSPPPPHAAFVVATDDGTVFHCHVEPFGGADVPKQHRWIFQSANTRFLGPLWEGIVLEHQLQRLVTNWWAVKKAFGEAR